LPFRVFGVGCSTFRVAAWRRPLVEFAARSEFSTRRSIMLMGYMIPLCRWPLPRLCGFSSSESADCCSGNPFHPLFEFRVPPECCSANPGRPASTGRLLSWALVPFSTCRYRRSTCCEFAALTEFRLQGLVTLVAVCSLRCLIDLVSCRQRSWDSPFGAILPSVRSRVAT
jgi:hypothetical protein